MKTTEYLVWEANEDEQNAWSIFTEYGALEAAKLAAETINIEDEYEYFADEFNVMELNVKDKETGVVQVYLVEAEFSIDYYPRLKEVKK